MPVSARHPHSGAGAPAEERRDHGQWNASFRQGACTQSGAGRGTGISRHFWPLTTPTPPSSSRSASSGSLLWACWTWSLPARPIAFGREDEVFRLSLTQADGQGDKRGSQGWYSMLTAHRQLAVLKLARGIVERRADDFDSDADLLNTPVGVVHLQIGVVEPHDPDLLVTKMTQGAYRPGHTHDDWTQALSALPEDRMKLHRRAHRCPDGYLAKTTETQSGVDGTDARPVRVPTGLRRQRLQRHGRLPSYAPQGEESGRRGGPGLATVNKA